MFATFCLLASASAAQLTGAFLHPYSQVYRVDVHAKHRTIHAADWQDKVEWITAGGRRVLRRTQISTQVNGVVRTWVNVFEPATMRPIASEFLSSNGDSYMRVIGGGFAKEYSALENDRAMPKVHSARVPAGTYDFTAGMYGVLLAAYPLADGYRNVVTTFDQNTLALQRIPFRVLRRETVKYKGRPLDTWVVRATYDTKYYPDEGELTMTFWLSRSAPYVYRLVMHQARSGVETDFSLT